MGRGKLAVLAAFVVLGLGLLWDFMTPDGGMIRTSSGPSSELSGEPIRWTAVDSTAGLTQVEIAHLESLADFARRLDREIVDDGYVWLTLGQCLIYYGSPDEIVEAERFQTPAPGSPEVLLEEMFPEYDTPDKAQSVRSFVDSLKLLDEKEPTVYELPPDGAPQRLLRVEDFD